MSTEDHVEKKQTNNFGVFFLMPVTLMTLYLKVILFFFFINLFKYYDIVYINLYVSYGYINYSFLATKIRLA